MNDKLHDWPNRNPVWAFQVKQKSDSNWNFVRWCGDLEQFNTDAANYVGSTEGFMRRLSKTKLKFHANNPEFSCDLRVVHTRNY